MVETKKEKTDGLISMESGVIYAVLLFVTTVLAYFDPEYRWGIELARSFATSSAQGTPYIPFNMMSLVRGTMYQVCGMMAVSLF
jgi:hypothetical protein